MNKSNILSVVAIAGVLILGLVVWNMPAPTQGPAGNPGTPGTPGTSATGKNLSAVASPDIQSPYVCWGGSCNWAGSMAMNPATTTICAFQSPAATSTLESILASITEGTTTATKVSIGFGTNSNSSSTVLVADRGLAANEKLFTFSASSTPLSPYTWVTVTQQGGATGGTFTNTGTCAINFQSSNR